MVTTVLVLVTAVHAFLFWWHARFARQRQLRFWLLPSTYFLITCALNFVFRGWYVVNAERGTYEIGQIIPALIYYGMFMIAFVGSTVLVYSMTIRTAPTPSIRWSGTAILICVLFAYLISEFAYRAATGNFRGLYAGSENVTQLPPLLDRIFSALAPLRWFLVGLCVIAAAQRPSMVLKVIMMVTALLFLGEAVITTSKGAVVNLILIHFLWAGVNGRKISKAFVVGAAAFAVLFSVYSYVARYHDSSVYDQVSLDSLKQRAKIVDARLGDEKDKQRAISSIFERFSYLDALMLCIEKFGSVDREQYFFGSLGEYPNLIPRAVWPDKPIANFNRYLTKQIYGFNNSPWAEMPIGRVSESYFVLSWVGLLYAPFTAVLFWAFYYYLFHQTTSPFSRAAFLMLLITYCIPDAHLFYQVATLIMWCVPVLVVLKVLANTLSTPEDRASQALPEPIESYDVLAGTPQYR